MPNHENDDSNEVLQITDEDSEHAEHLDSYPGG